MHKSRLYLKSFHCNTMSEPKMLYLELETKVREDFTITESQVKSTY